MSWTGKRKLTRAGPPELLDPDYLQALQKLGERGWEVVGLYPAEDVDHALLKRPKI